MEVLLTGWRVSRGNWEWKAKRAGPEDGAGPVGKPGG